METESRYLKKIRDVIHKKNTGSGSGTIYSGPNTKAKYLHDIAKEVDKLDIGGGGSGSNLDLLLVPIKDGYIDIPTAALINAEQAGKAICLVRLNEMIPFTGIVSQGNLSYFTFTRTSIETETMVFPPDETGSDAIKLVKTEFKVEVSTGAITSKVTTSHCKVVDIISHTVVPN